MKTITIDDELYAYIASQTKYIGEGASDILRRLLLPETEPQQTAPVIEESVEAETVQEAAVEAAPSEKVAIESAPNDEVVADVNTDSEGVFSLLASTTIDASASKVEIFLQVLSALHQTNSSAFKRVLDVKGRNRLYFANSKEELLASGSSTNPKQVPASEFWVVTNNNTGKKVAILKEVAQVLGYSQQDTQRLVAVFAPESA